MSKFERNLLLAALIVWATLILLFANGVNAKPFVSDDGETVTMDKKSFNKMLETIAAQQNLLNRANSKAEMFEQRYDAVEMCVRDAANNGRATTPCFNVDPTAAFSPKEHQRVLKNTVEY